MMNTKSKIMRFRLLRFINDIMMKQYQEVIHKCDFNKIVIKLILMMIDLILIMIDDNLVDIDDDGYFL